MIAIMPDIARMLCCWLKALDRMKITKLSDSMRSEINKDYDQQLNRIQTNGRSRPHSMDTVVYEKLLGAEKPERFAIAFICVSGLVEVHSICPLILILR